MNYKIWIVISLVLLGLIVEALIPSNTFTIRVEEAKAQEVSEPRMITELIAVAKCESGLRHFLPDGSVLVSKTKDVGIFQINLAAHGKELEKLGLDPYDYIDNITFAILLYNRSGLQPWYMSSSCLRRTLGQTIALKYP